MFKTSANISYGTLFGTVLQGVPISILIGTQMDRQRMSVFGQELPHPVRQDATNSMQLIIGT